MWWVCSGSQEIHVEAVQCEAPQSLQVTLKWFKEQKEKNIHREKYTTQIWEILTIDESTGRIYKYLSYYF